MNQNGKPVPVRLAPKDSVRRLPRRDTTATSRFVYRPPQKGLPPEDRRPRSGWWKGFLIVIISSVLTTLVIKASEKLPASPSALIAQVGKSEDVSPCPAEMAYVPTSSGGFCIDRFEASASHECPNTVPGNQFDTLENLGIPTCRPESKANVLPWTNVTLHQALQLCARAGKRLPTHAEWYRAALGTPDVSKDPEAGCVLGRIGAHEAEKTGAHAQCVSSFGVHDMIGNVWEWIDAYAASGWYKNRLLPDEGFVAEVDEDGVAVATATTSSPLFGGDYFFVEKSGVYGMFRGGYWNMTERAGIHTVSATVPSSFLGRAVGFRCVK